MQRLVLAIDVGGTKLATGIVDAAGAVAGYVELPTPAADAETIFGQLRAAIARSLDATGVPASRLEGVGVGCGGPMRYPEGRVSPLNIPGWRDFPLRARLAEALGCPVVVDNDAKAMALGEHWRGAGQGARCLLGMVVSTGVGGGIVVDGRLLHGAQGNAGHIGHVIVAPNGPRCPCGARGCVEAVASGPSIARADPSRCRPCVQVASTPGTKRPIGRSIDILSISSCGRARLPTWVVNSRSVLRFMAALRDYRCAHLLG